MKETLEYIVLL